MNKVVTAIVAIVARSKLLFAILALWLTAGITAGYFIGVSDNTKGMSQVVHNHTEPRMIGDKVFLVYTCKGNEYARYSLASGELLPNVQEDLFGQPEGFFKKTYLQGIAVVGTSGGLAGVRYVKPFVQSLKLSGFDQKKYFIVGIITAGPALYLGYQIGAHGTPSCDDDRILTKVRQGSTWKPLSNQIASALLKQAEIQADVNGVPIDQRTVLDRTRSQIELGTVDAQLFKNLLGVSKEYTKKLERSGSASWALEDFLIFAAVIAILAVFYDYFIGFRSLKRKNK